MAQAAASAAGKAFSPFLHAWHDPLAGLKVHSSCVQLADLECDGDTKLCICDLDKKLKIYKGTTLASEYAILDTPVAMSIIYSETAMVRQPQNNVLFMYLFNSDNDRSCSSQPRIPSIAVAAGSHVFIYRQLRPYRKVMYFIEQCVQCNF